VGRPGRSTRCEDFPLGYRWRAAPKRSNDSLHCGQTDVSVGYKQALATDEHQPYQRTLSKRSLTADEADASASSAPTPTRRPKRDARELQLGAELKNRAALGDHGWTARRADVLLDSLGGAPGGLISAGLVLADRHGHAGVRAAAKGRVADEAGHPADEVLHVLLALSEEIKKLRSTRPE